VAVVGPRRDGAGGIASVLVTLTASSLAERFELLVVATHRDGGRAAKTLQAVIGFIHSGWVLARGVDVVYIHTSSGSSIRRKGAIAAVARLLRRPYVLHVHSHEFDNAYRAAGTLDQWLIRRTLRGASRVIALSPTWARRIETIVDCDTRSILNPVSIPAEHATLTASPPSIVSLGRLGERKGSSTLIRALGALASQHAAAELVLAGDGDPTQLRGEAQRCGVGDRVRMPGWVGPEERARILLRGTVFGLPAQEEGLPVSLLEAMAYGLPAVVSPVGGIPDIFEDGVHGFFVPPDEPEAVARALHRVLDSPALARTMGVRARETAERRFATEVIAKQIAEVLDEVVSASRAPVSPRATRSP
jgi:glycosyltransferase involved in cell wall biosynthesis